MSTTRRMVTAGIAAAAAGAALPLRAIAAVVPATAPAPAAEIWTVDEIITAFWECRNEAEWAEFGYPNRDDLLDQARREDESADLDGLILRVAERLVGNTRQ